MLRAAQPGVIKDGGRDCTTTSEIGEKERGQRLACFQPMAIHVSE